MAPLWISSIYHPAPPHSFALLSFSSTVPLVSALQLYFSLSLSATLAMCDSSPSRPAWFNGGSGWEQTSLLSFPNIPEEDGFRLCVLLGLTVTWGGYLSLWVTVSDGFLYLHSLQRWM